MKYLLDGQCKVLRKGAFVKADESVHERIYDDETVENDSDFTVAVLKSICDNNNIPHKSSATRGDLISNLNIHLSKLDVPEQNKMSQSDLIKQIVTEAGANRPEGQDADAFEIDVFTQCIEKLNAEGITFKIKQLGGLVKKEIAQQGLVVTASQRREAIFDILEEAKFAPENYDEVVEMQERLISEAPDTDHKQALQNIRKYCKENEIELPKRSSGKKKMNFRQAAIQFMIDNSPCSEQQLLEFVTERGRDEPEKVVARLSSLRETIDAAFAAGVSSVTGDAKAA